MLVGQFKLFSTNSIAEDLGELFVVSLRLRNLMFCVIVRYSAWQTLLEAHQYFPWRVRVVIWYGMRQMTGHRLSRIYKSLESTGERR